MSNAEAARVLLDQPTPDLATVRAILAEIVRADDRDRMPSAAHGFVEFLGSRGHLGAEE